MKGPVPEKQGIVTEKQSGDENCFNEIDQEGHVLDF